MQVPFIPLSLSDKSSAPVSSSSSGMVDSLLDCKSGSGSETGKILLPAQFKKNIFKYLSKYFKNIVDFKMGYTIFLPSSCSGKTCFTVTSLITLG